MALFLRLGFLLIFATVCSTDVKNNNSIVDTHDKLLKYQIEIIQIYTESSEIISQDNLDKLTARLYALEREFKELNGLADVRREYVNGSCDAAMEILTNQYGFIDRQLKRLPLILNTRSLLLEMTPNITEIVEDIKIMHFKEAEEKLSKSSELIQIPEVVRQVYSNSESNFNLIVNLAEALSKINLSFEVLKSLHGEMLKNGHQDPRQLIVLSEKLAAEVMDKRISEETKMKAISIIGDLMSTIKETASEYLINAMNAGDYENNVNVQALASALHNLRPSLSDEVIKSVVDVSYEKVETSKILSDIYSLSNGAQVMTGLSELFWKIKSANKLNDDVVLQLARRLKHLRERPSFESLTQARKDAFAQVVDTLPTCVRNLYFSPSVCLKNKATNTPLIAADSVYNYDTTRRNIFVSTKNASSCKDPPTGASWLVEEKGDKILFNNIAYPNEYLYIAQIDQSPESHYIFNWIPGNNTDDQSAFNIELKDDHCYLRSVFYNEYLYASDVKYEQEQDYSYVFGWKAGPKGEKSDFLWQITKC